MNFEFVETEIDNIKHLVVEADQKRVFLPELKEPDFKALDLFEEFLDDDRFHVFSFMSINGFTGFISIIPTKDESILAIGPMYICNEFKGQGLGKAQVFEVIKWAKSRGIKKIVTRTWGKNKASRAIFEGLGFSVIEEKPNMRVDGDSTLRYVYEI